VRVCPGNRVTDQDTLPKSGDAGAVAGAGDALLIEDSCSSSVVDMYPLLPVVVALKLELVFSCNLLPF
jgi:hypothetical protein